MPVNILYCEGGRNSPDIRVLLNILSAICTIRPAGSKYGLDRQILFIKQENLLPGSIVAALKDRDFVSCWWCQISKLSDILLRKRLTV